MPYLILDVETAPHPCVADLVPPPDLGTIKPKKGLKDPKKIEESITERKTEALAAHEDLIGKAALDYNVNRLVAIGTHYRDRPEPEAWLCRDEGEEAACLIQFWDFYLKKRPTLVGFRLRVFDLPVMLQRSRLLGVKTPKIDLSPFGRSRDVIDLFDELTFHNTRDSVAVMSRALKSFCKRFGIPIPDPIGGKEIPELVASGDWEGVRSHCLSDVDLTRELALRIGLVSNWARVA